MSSREDQMRVFLQASNVHDNNKEHLHYDDMNSLADLFDGWAMDQRFDSKQSAQLLGFAEGFRKLAENVGPEWQPPYPQRLSIFGFLAKMLRDNCAEQDYVILPHDEVDLVSEDKQGLQMAKRFCRELLARKAPTGEQCVHIGKALRCLEAFPNCTQRTAIEVGVLAEQDRDHESWVLQVCGASVTLRHGGSEWSHGYDHYTNFYFQFEPPKYVVLTGDFSTFESVYKELEWDGYRLYTLDEG